MDALVDIIGSGVGGYYDHLCSLDLHGKEALGFENLNFSSINYNINARFAENGDMAMPTTREVSFILDETETDVLPLNGNNDIVM